MRAKVGRMRGRTLGLAAVALLAVGGTFISPAVGGPNFLTLPKAKKAFFTKSQTKAKFLRKANAYNRAQANARFLDPAEGDSRYLPISGATRLQISPNDWVSANPGGTSSVSFSSTSSGTDLRTGSANTDQKFRAGLTIPSSLQGRQTRITSFELCYEADAPFVVIDRVSLMVTSATPAQPVSPGTTPIEDLTDRGDEACRTYSGAAPVVLGPNDMASVIVWVDFTTMGAITITRLTVNLAN